MTEELAHVAHGKDTNDLLVIKHDRLWISELPIDIRRTVFVGLSLAVFITLSSSFLVLSTLRRWPTAFYVTPMNMYHHPYMIQIPISTSKALSYFLVGVPIFRSQNINIVYIHEEYKPFSEFSYLIESSPTRLSTCKKPLQPKRN